MRIISGKARGHKLFMVKSLGTRPTADRVKESMFNIIGQDLKGLNVLDVFAGVGSIGLEALSRGADRVVFVDFKRECAKIITRNLNHTKLDNGNVQIINDDFRKVLNRMNEEFDLIFVDPPYATDYAVTALQLIKENQLLSDNGILIIEHDKTFQSEFWLPFRVKQYGQTYLSFFRK